MQSHQRQGGKDDHEVFPLSQGERLGEMGDKKTRELYSVIATIGQEQRDEKLMKEAEELTLLKSLFHVSRCKHFQQIKDNTLTYRGVTLKQKSQSTQFAKNRTYSIIKATKERKRTLTENDFLKIFNSQGKTKEIMYEYNRVQVRNEESNSTNYVVAPTGKSSRKDLRSLLSTRINPCSLETETKEYCQKAKSYKFLKMTKGFKAEKQEKQPCNIFNFLDNLVNKQQVSGCLLEKMQVISKQKRPKPWI